jgi:hypothetical protein
MIFAMVTPAETAGAIAATGGNVTAPDAVANLDAARLSPQRSLQRSVSTADIRSAVSAVVMAIASFNLIPVF